MKYLTAALLLLGMALLGVIVYQTDLTEVWNRLRELGGWGIAVILGVYCLAFLAQTLSWHLTLPSARPGKKWFYQLGKVMLVGEALNSVTPLASVGGEPLKAVLLKKHYGIGYQEAAASLLLQLTVQNLGLISFLLIGFLLMLGADILPPPYPWVAGFALVIFSVCIMLFFLVQRYQLFSRIGGRLGLGTLLTQVRDFEDHLTAFYRNRRRFGLVVTVEFGIWALSTVEIYCALYFLGYPVGWADAWTMAAVVALVHAVLFFVPGNIGTQEGAFVLVGGALTGSPELGLAVSLVVRFRELVWIVAGLLLGWLFSLTPPRSGDLSSDNNRQLME